MGPATPSATSATGPETDDAVDDEWFPADDPSGPAGASPESRSQHDVSSAPGMSSPASAKPAWGGQETSAAEPLSGEDAAMALLRTGLGATIIEQPAR
ncbi:hypothetical protein [Protofrankia symbiont of Coriaria myrtifolia]|uniref:hypothetical protein n=1 Tax=Protofrankia symbiont of Coriaria myrtifolia TaxID=1306540 RepID=UPI001041B97F|nr:hypothetical protein [Protofrankia symbiont of Coriaria myrtifolia]